MLKQLLTLSALCALTICGQAYATEAPTDEQSTQEAINGTDSEQKLASCPNGKCPKFRQAQESEAEEVSAPAPAEVPVEETKLV